MPRRGQRFEICTPAEAVDRLGLPLPKLLRMPGAQRLVRVVDGRREDAVRVPVLDAADAERLQLRDSIVDYVRSHPGCSTKDVQRGLSSASPHTVESLLAELERDGALVFAKGRNSRKAWRVAEESRDPADSRAMSAASIPSDACRPTSLATLDEPRP